MLEQGLPHSRDVGKERDPKHSELVVAEVHRGGEEARHSEDEQVDRQTDDELVDGEAMAQLGLNDGDEETRADPAE